ncbi:MAG: hypothetical protein JWQ71_1690 [Pedosphaera sp.]|nr:hypothetical protein [Pedosphaera sp.]
MRTKTLLVTAALAAAGVATSMAQSNVYSLNVVGYVNVPVANGFSLIQNPLNVASGNSLESTIGTNCLDGTTVYQYDNASHSYSAVATFIAQGANIWDGPVTLNPGEGFFIYSPGAQTLTFTGEVLQGNLTNSIPNGFSIKASQVPQGGGLISSLGMQVKDQDTVYTFANGQYSLNTYYASPTVPAGAEFWDGGTEPVLAVGESFFILTSSSYKWTRTFNVQ